MFSGSVLRRCHTSIETVLEGIYFYLESEASRKGMMHALRQYQSWAMLEYLRTTPW